MYISKALLVKSLRELLTNLSYVEGPSEKLQCILKSHKIRSNFYTESTLGKLLCKLKDWVATDDKNNISDEHKRSVRKCDCEKNEIAKPFWEANHNFSWDQTKVADRENRLI